jgi:transketolase
MKMASRFELANCIRALAMDAVQKANSGHPGMPMGMADIAEVLWNDFLKHNPCNPQWANRDRFILSNGHGSMLQYALLHLSGYDLSIEDIKQFRQLHSKTPGHPEYGITPGVETTTGPLGQGLAHAVGMALAEKLLAQTFNTPEFSLVDHHTYVFLGDGCLMEGISHEVCSLAGTWKLEKLIAIWDDNGISIDGDVKNWFTDDTPVRFRAYGWHVIENVDGHSSAEIHAALTKAHTLKDKPVLICCKTTIGFGSPSKAGTCDAHGSPLGENEIAAARKNLSWEYPPFEIPEKYYAAWNAKEKGQQKETTWQQLFEKYQKTFPEKAGEFLRRMKGELPQQFNTQIEKFLAEIPSENIASRKSSQLCLNALSAILPELLGGSADLTHSNLTLAKNAVAMKNYIYYGVREFGMSAIMAGIALHSGFIPFGGTFLTFCDYARNAIRLSALMRIRVIYVYTHDSIGLGEDGPTHQPIEHIAMLRATPNLFVWRPCDTAETMIAWQAAIENKTAPSCLLLSRQNLPVQQHRSADDIKRGGYILHETNASPDIILIATGSEVSLAMDATKQLETQYQKNIRVVSMPCVEVFLQQENAYQEKVLPPNIKKRIAIEAGAKDSWYRFTGFEGYIIGLETFGESAPANAVYKALGITVENIVERSLNFI